MGKAMFDYGRSANASSRSKYKYYYFEKDLQIGSYPIDNFDGINKFNEPKMLINGKQAWGEISYDAQLTSNQLMDYDLKSVDEEAKMQALIDQAKSAASQPKPPQNVEQKLEVVEQPVVQEVHQETEPVVQPTEVKMVVLDNVPDSMVYPTKNPKYMVLSLKTKLSDNGYGNIVMPSESFTKQPDGSYSIELGKEGSWRNVGVKSGNDFIKEKRNLSEIVSLYESSKLAKEAESSAEQSSVHIETKTVETPKPELTQHVKATGKTAYLNGVLSKWIRETENPQYKSVSIPYAASESGYGRLLIESSKIFQSTNLQTNTPVPGHMNVNLGPGDGTIDISIKQNGKFEKQYLKRSGLADIFRASRKAYADNKTNDLHEQFHGGVTFDESEAIFE